MVVVGWLLDFIILAVFSSLDDYVILQTAWQLKLCQGSCLEYEVFGLCFLAPHGQPLSQPHGSCCSMGPWDWLGPRPDSALEGSCPQVLLHRLAFLWAILGLLAPVLPLTRQINSIFLATSSCWALPELCCQLPSVFINPALKTLFLRNFTVIDWGHNKFFQFNEFFSL